MAKKLNYIVHGNDPDSLEKSTAKLKEYGATPEMFEYIADTIRAQHERFGELSLGIGLGLDLDAEVTNAETKEPIKCGLLVYQLDVSKASNRDELLNRVIIGFQLDENQKITNLVNMS